MLLHFDFADLSARLVRGFLKTNRAQPVSVRTFSDGVATALPSGASITLRIKPRAERDTDSLITPPTFAVNGTTATQYDATIDAYTAASVALLGLDDADVTTDLPSYPCDLAILYRTSDATAWADAQESATIPIEIEAAVNLPDDTPTLPLSAVAITPRSALTGGAAGSLDAIVTAGGAIVSGQIVLAVVSSVLSVWRFQAGTTAEDPSGGIVRPDDYHASTNANIWSQIL